MRGLVALPDRISKNASTRYAVAAGATVIASLIRLGLNGVLGDDLPYITLFPAIALSAWFCGLGPSIVSILLGLVCARYWFVAPQHALGAANQHGIISILGFLLASAVIVAIGEVSR